jgi:hypothetical protein
MKENKIDVPFGWFNSDQFPFVDPDTKGQEDGEISDRVLIDIDGKRETFAVGCYHFPYTMDGDLTEGFWSVGEFYQSSLDEEAMRWSYLPLARYGNKDIPGY